MPLVLLSGPAVEPVSLAESKAHLRVDHASEDALIASLVLTSRLHIEAAFGLALVTQTWRLVRDAWPDGDRIDLPLGPLQAIEAVRVATAPATITVLPAADYEVDGVGSPPRLVAVGQRFPASTRKTGGIEIDMRVGYGDAAADVPEPIRQAILMLVAHWYEHRDPIEIGTPATRIPAAVGDLLAGLRKVRL